MKLLAIYGGYVLLTNLLYFLVFWSDDNPQTYYGIRAIAALCSVIVVLWEKQIYYSLKTLTQP